MVLTDKPEVSWTDAALFVEELAEIYTTSTPKGWREAEKVIGIDSLDILIQWPGFIFIPWADKSPKRTRLDNKKKY